MSRGGMSCDGATSVGKGTMMGGMTSGAATTTLGAVGASSDGTLSHTPPSDGATSHCKASDGRIMTGGTRDHDRRDRRGEGQPQHSDRRLSPPMRGAGSRDERHTSAAGGQLDAKQLSGRISHASGADELLRLFAAHSANLNHIHAANLWNKLGKQRIERRHEGRLEQLMLGEPDAGGECSDRGSAWAPSHNGSAAEWVRLEFGDEPLRMIGLQVREVLAAPFILRVEVESEEAQRWTIWNGTDETPCPGWFDLSYDSGSQAIAAVYIFTQADGFEEIDAVSLEVPIPCSPSPPPESPSTPLPAFAVLTARPLAVVLALVAAWLLLFAYLCLRVQRPNDGWASREARRTPKL
ncbi:hypothetical protein EMIHUDRAFT_200384 [Emiliania huxleyi CCMP1516]|uniref:F5/8 type C domain-containing protein n=4 Tax=Emiliania huxleyi TaxID=2903 RepID=A0A0D3KQH2_EMIH1|nr:hypothetical protein EMIHUDRAFT_200384 [Emiliania huxleyi CCMP1516]EOD38007.1 hypothetical protein EMIHUDRAFT_200384 [Emiliania huxleyi CCMP1516]|eukprot:XP_005790436.1 hypothetical protein EMIHUDRAFT_200384 [Emiliania huxleyi CCMP1516]